MQNNPLNDLVLYRQKYTSDLIDQPTIASMLQLQPERMSGMLSYIFGEKGGEKVSVLNLVTGGLGRTSYIESYAYDWDVMIEEEIPVTIVDAQWQGATIASTDVPGINGTPITIWTAEKFWDTGAILEFDDKDYTARVMSAPYQDGHYWVSILQVSDGQAESYIPPSLLAKGCQLSKLGTMYEEASEEGDIVTYQTPMRLRNYLTTMRVHYDITGSAYASVMIIEMKNPETGAKTKMWADYQEWRALRYWFKQTERQLVYDRCTVHKDGTVSIKGSNGYPIYRGAGLLQQMASSNRQYYTTLTADLLEDFLFDLAYNIRGMGDRKYMAFTGEMGMKELDRVLRAKASALGITVVTGAQFITGTGQNLTLGGQFTTYKMLNGIELTLKHFPLYDDTYHNRKLHPTTGKPVESYRMTFLDVGMRDGEANITKVVRKGREMVMWAEAGSFVPGLGFSTDKNLVRSNGKDKATIHILGEMGIWMKDPTTSGELILDVD